MRACARILDPVRTERLLLLLSDAIARHAVRLDQRAASGRVRHIHGDLHLGNIALIDGEPTPFDCLEFSTELATGDVLYDLAFLLMDLWQREQRNAANILFNRYLDFSPVDEDGIVLLPLLMAMRAAIRAHVLAVRVPRNEGDFSGHRRARAYLDLALALLEPQPVRLIAIGGLSGTGKSTLARWLGGDIGQAPGARILRSDILRKRLGGVSPDTRLSPDHYSVHRSAETYDLLERQAGVHLAAGCSVIADAVFGARAERDAVATVARRFGIPFDGIWLETATAMRLRRVAQRTADVSDADVAIAQAQSDPDAGALETWHRLSAHGQPDEIAAEARMLLGLEA